VSQSIQVALITKAGCHLCDDARLVVNAVIADFRSQYTGVFRHVQVDFVEHDINFNDDLRAKHSEEIPVVLINGKIHNYWRIDPERFRAALSDLV
jgi:glutaredoxin